MIGHVQGLPGTPNEAQLKSKTLVLDQALTKIVMALPGRVLAPTDEDFEALGWSMRDNVVTDSGKIHGVESCGGSGVYSRQGSGILSSHRSEAGRNRRP